MSILEDAFKLIDKRRQIEKERAPVGSRQKIALRDQKTANDLQRRLLAYIPGLPVASELLSSYYHRYQAGYPFYEIHLASLTPSDPNVVSLIIQNSGEIKEFDQDLGYDSAPLMQTLVQDDEKIFNYYKAWAVLFDDIYHLQIYFVPYLYEPRGFAVVVYDTSDTRKHFFPHDIDRTQAIRWVADSLTHIHSR